MYKRNFTRVKAVLKSLQKGSSINEACRGAGIDVVSLWRWRKKDKRLDELIKTTYDSRIQIVEDALYKSALEGNTAAQIFFLKNRDINRWRDKQEISHEGIGSTNIIVVRDGNKTKELAGQVCIQQEEVSGAVQRLGNGENSRLDLAGNAIQRADTE